MTRVDGAPELLVDNVPEAVAAGDELEQQDDGSVDVVGAGRIPCPAWHTPAPGSPWWPYAGYP
jgi:hypothetical protein